MSKTRREADIEDEAREIQETIEAESAATYRDLLTPPPRPAFRVGIGVPVINQLCGVNAVIYYTPTILKQSGFGDSAAILGSVGVGGGLTNKAVGRVGDSPLIGAGTYADDRSVAVSATGAGEAYIRASAAVDIAKLVSYRGWSVQRAARVVIPKRIPALGGDEASSRSTAQAAWPSPSRATGSSLRG